MGKAALDVKGASHTFHAGSSNELRALNEVDLSLEAGSFMVVIGLNGSGKSTLLNAVAGALYPLDEGQICIAGQNVTRWPEHRRAALIGRVFQNPFTGSAAELTIAQHMALAGHRGQRASLRLAIDATRREAIRAQVAGLGMGLEDRLATPMGALSGGQRQALTLLMATMVRPTVLLLDEHTAALDPRSAEQVLRVTQELVTRELLTTLMVTHSLQQAVRMGDRVIMMHRGRIVHDFSGARKRRLRVDDLLDCFEEVRSAEMLDESAAEMLRRVYV
jgi:putative ABC transport system ATP-binding protein